MPVSPLKTNFYADCRLQNSNSGFLHEEGSPIPERLLQIVWHHQRLLRDQLKTLDGKVVRVLHPGFWNSEAGPDFRDAVIQIGDDAAKSGDVEIDLRSGGWRDHRHDRNPNFKNVILHIIWEPDDASKIPAPTLALKTFLDSPVNELKLWLGSDFATSFPRQSVGQCCAPLSELSQDKMTELLRQAAHVRLQRKANDFEARARQSGWEQAFWEGTFRALGYKQNVWPMQRLAELMPALNVASERTNNPPLFWQAWLLGISGLIPPQAENLKEVSYISAIWDVWWRERQASSELILPKTLWRFNGMRPANHPQRRLAWVSHWLADAKFFAKLEQWFLIGSEQPESSLVNLLQGKEDSFWSWHWTLRSERLPKPQPLIGAARINDLAVNVILPWFWIRAKVGKNEELQLRAEKIYFNWPAADDNSVLRLARQRLLGGLPSRQFQTAALQQGLLQIVRDFCNHSNAVCAECRFPDLVRSWDLQTVAAKKS